MFKNKKIIIILIILSFLTVNINVLSEKISQDSNIKNEIVTIKIGTNLNGYKAKYIDISYIHICQE